MSFFGTAAESVNVSCSLVRMMVGIFEADVYEVLDPDVYSTDEHAA